LDLQIIWMGSSDIIIKKQTNLYNSKYLYKLVCQIKLKKKIKLCQ
jgi:hypothetical protein